MDLLAARYELRDRNATARAKRLLTCANAFAAYLVAQGATRVVLFGSLARGAPAHPATDLDLAVSGMDRAAVLRATAELEARLGHDVAWVGDRPRGVDLVRLEDASDELKAQIEADGKDLASVSG